MAGQVVAKHFFLAVQQQAFFPFIHRWQDNFFGLFFINWIIGSTAEQIPLPAPLIRQRSLSRLNGSISNRL